MFYTRSSFSIRYPKFSAFGGMIMSRFSTPPKKHHDPKRNLADDRNIVIKKAVKGTCVVVYVYMAEV